MATLRLTVETHLLEKERTGPIQVGKMRILKGDRMGGKKRDASHSRFPKSCLHWSAGSRKGSWSTMKNDAEVGTRGMDGVQKKEKWGNRKSSIKHLKGRGGREENGPRGVFGRGMG